MKKITLLFTAFTFSVNGFAQTTFWKLYGGSGKDECMEAFQTNDGGYIIVGGTTATGAGGKDVYLIKTDSFGDTIWTKAYGGPDFDLGSSVRQTIDGGYIIAGRTKSFGAGSDDVYIIKTNENGDTLWTRTYGAVSSEVGNSIQQTNDGGYIISGTDYSSPLASAYLIRINSSGDTLWTNNFIGIENTSSTRVIETIDGGFVLIGGTSAVSGSAILILKTSANGALVWLRYYFIGIGSSYGYSVLQSVDSGFVILGTNSTYPGGISLIKTDSLGYLVWLKIYEGSIFGYNSLVTLNDGGYLITGMGSYYINNCVYGYNVHLIRTNSTGDTIWTRTYLTPTDRYFSYSVALTSDGGYLLAGSGGECSGGDINIFLIKTDSVGNVVGINNIEKEDNSFTLFPNPATSELRIENAELRIREIEIYNTLGEKRLTPTLSKGEGVRVDVSSLPAGVYFVAVTDDKGNKITKRFIKM